jgi:hypothetical protein
MGTFAFEKSTIKASIVSDYRIVTNERKKLGNHASCARSSVNHCLRNSRIGRNKRRNFDSTVDERFKAINQFIALHSNRRYLRYSISPLWAQSSSFEIDYN